MKDRQAHEEEQDVHLVDLEKIQVKNVSTINAKKTSMLLRNEQIHSHSHGFFDAQYS